MHNAQSSINKKIYGKDKVKMDMDVFAANVSAAVKKEIGAGYTVDVNKVRKNNGVVLHGLTIRRQGQNVSPAIYLEQFMEAHESGMPFDALIGEIIAIYKRYTPGKSIDMDFFRIFENVKDRICFRLIRKERNEDLLKDVPHTDFLDLAVCFCYAHCWDGIGNGSILLNNSHMEMWNTSEEELYRLAERNTPRIFPWLCRTMREFVEETMGNAAETAENVFLDEAPFKVLSNTERTHGAACILYPGVLEKLAQKEQRNLYIIPSSVHETLLIADTGGDDLADMIKETIVDVNRTQIAPEEVLSDSLYYYDLSEKQLKIA